eukprot:5347581-Alexandrium_andersonii.AAC.1
MREAPPLTASPIATHALQPPDRELEAVLRERLLAVTRVFGLPPRTMNVPGLNEPIAPRRARAC